VPGGLTAQHLLFFAILLCAFVLLATERIRNDVVAVMIILALVGTGLLEPREALAGFASEPAIVVASVFVLLTIYAVVAFVTEFMSDAATTALLAPVAAALAPALGQPPEPYVVTVAMASVTAFLTPMAHHGNLVVYGPGGYRFWDFARVGAPLTIAIALTVTLMAPLIWR
jgi:di/tricarboxylate transporter